MNIITNRPIEVKSSACGCSGVDGSSTYEQILAFQQWANSKKGAKLAVDGKYGPLTGSAFTKWGAEYDKSTAAPTNQGRQMIVAAVNGVNVYSIYEGNPIVATVNKGKTIGVYAKDKDANHYFVETVAGKAYVSKLLTNMVAEKKPVGVKPIVAKPPVADSAVSPAVSPVEADGFMGKLKALPMPVKIGIGVGLAGILTFIIWKLIPSKNKK